MIIESATSAIRQRSCDVLARRGLLHVFRSGEAGSVRTVLYRRCAVAIYTAVFSGVQLSPAPPKMEEPSSISVVATPPEPITPVPDAPITDLAKVRIGERLFGGACLMTIRVVARHVTICGQMARAQRDMISDLTAQVFRSTRRRFSMPRSTFASAGRENSTPPSRISRRHWKVPELWAPASPRSCKS
jgi:hypothetical protein